MKPTLPILRAGVGLLVLSAIRPPLAAQTCQLDQTAMLYATNYQRGVNYRSFRGVPLSSTVGTPIGSDGRLSVGDNPTLNQFSGLLNFGAVVRPAKTDLVLNGAVTNYAQNAENLDLPRGKSGGQVVMVLRSAQAGTPYFGRLVSFSFGSIITPPEMTDTGLPLPVGTPASNYWRAEPYTTDNHTNASYYWSPHAGVVFAVQAGPIQVTWRRLQTSGTNPPAGPSVNIGGLYFSVTNISYVVSGTACKSPQTIYWTESAFSTVGRPVDVPGVRIGAVNVIYNNDVPERVSAAEAYVAPEQTLPTSATNMLLETRTLWFEQSQIHAYNKEGRVFVELLGDATGPATRKHLGFEIVDIYKFAVPADRTAELGERIQPYQELDDPALSPAPLLTVLSGDFLYQHPVAGSAAIEYYAARKTDNVNDTMVYWLKTGVEGLQWPFLYCRYRLDWPTNVTRYSHYVRPLVATEAEAKLTAVALPSDNVPIIQYQDPLDQPRGKLTETFAYYSFLDAAHPAHRALLRFTAGDSIAFERVFSWLDSSLRATNFTGSVATNLTEIDNYLYFAARSAAYSNQLVEASAHYLAQSNAYNNYLTANRNYHLQYTAYTNYLAQSAAYSNQLAAYTAYTNWLAQYALYTNMANLTRGVNGSWKLYARTYSENFDFGWISSWSVVVVSTNATTGLWTTNTFDGPGVDLNDDGTVSPYPAGKTVSGINNAVQFVQVKLNGFSYSWPTDVEVQLVGPNYPLACALYGRAGYYFYSDTVNLVFDDAATALIPYGLVASGTYRPTDSYPGGPPAPGATVRVHSLDALLLPMRSHPGPAPAYAEYPGTPPVVSDPGGPPTVVLEPTLPEAGPAPSPGLWATGPTAPRLEFQTVEVGKRITAPTGELGSESYLAGHLNPAIGTLYHPGAYVDPLTAGFAAANLGAIIPVNAVPGTNELEVWWFRTNSANAGPNAGNQTKGFLTIYWPSVLGHYTIQWPADADEIVLAGNQGSGALTNLQARGSIYTQNDKTQPGYNPNEEHALISAGRAYALRNDLNITTQTHGEYSSAPFVLLDYTEADGRPAIHAFHVLREKPAANPPVVFDYPATAGQVLQGPMPLSLLSQAIVNRPSDNPLDPQQLNCNEELGKTNILTSTRSSNTTSLAVGSRFRLGTYLAVTLQDLAVQPAIRRAFYVTAASATNIFGISGESFLVGSNYVTNSFPNQPYYVVASNFPIVSNRIVYLVNETSRTNWPVIIADRSINGDSVVLRVDFGIGAGPLPPGAINGANAYAYRVVVPHYDLPTASFYDAQYASGAYNGWFINCQDLPPGLPDDGSPLRRNGNSPNFCGSFTYQDRKGALWVYRGPHGEGASQLSMRFFYKTLPGFFFPSLPMANQPPVGTITPYLRPAESDGTFNDTLFDPVTGCAQGQTNDAQSLTILYRPQWPEVDAELDLAETLTMPKRGLPQVRGQSSLRVLYQQSKAQNGGDEANHSVVLHDPTREKQFSLAKIAGAVLNKLPSSANTSSYQGKTFFPNLPPHLAERFFYDPNRGPNGALVFQGQFKAEVVGEDYLLLNVLSESDQAELKKLVVAGDQDKAKWDAAIDGLQTALETYREDPAKPGTYGVAPTLSQTVGPGQLAKLLFSDTAVDSYALTAIGPGHGFVTLVAGDGCAKFTRPDDPVQFLIVKVGASLHRGEIKIVESSNPLSEKLTFQQVVDLAGTTNHYVFDWRYAAPLDGAPPSLAPDSDNPGAAWLALDPAVDFPDGVRANWGGSPSVKTISDNYLIMRYGKMDAATGATIYSAWTVPQLAEGYIKRVLAGINPFNQRVTDLYNNTVNTDANILTSAGHRWEGDVALNLEAVNQAGLIEIYETVLRRGRSLSIDAGFNYGPANDALLLAAGYLNDLYMLIGNEAYADAANPTIGIGTKDNTYGDIATALFAFKGQVPSLLEEELALLRGRDDVLQPGVETAPVYNRLFWNYTRGIDAGEVIYALNYNILDQNGDGRVDAADAAVLFPQGHGDAYGHYLTALKGYCSLLLNKNFDWVPRTEAVTILGKPVQVDYLDERKYAAAAAAVARTGRQIFDLTWRQDYLPGSTTGWDHLATCRVSTRTVLDGTNQINLVRHWGADQWASRSGQGALFNWVMGNAILPDVDPDPTHEGIQKIDRTTVPELQELAATAADLQTDMDNAEGRLTPLGLAQGSLAFDLDPNLVTGANPKTHFEQVYDRAKGALNNAVASFDDAKDVTRLMRSEQDSLADFQAALASQELAFTNALIELYGTPYTDDIGPGQTFKEGYAGPDLIHFAYVEMPQLTFPGLLTNTQSQTFRIDIQNFTAGYECSDKSRFDFIKLALNNNPDYLADTHYISFSLDSSGNFQKPAGWSGRRASPGKLQDAIARIQLARNAALGALFANDVLKRKLDRSLEYFQAKQDAYDQLHQWDVAKAELQTAVESAIFVAKMYLLGQKTFSDALDQTTEKALEAIPKSTIVGTAVGGDTFAAARAAILAGFGTAKAATDSANFAKEFAVGAFTTAKEGYARIQDATVIAPLMRTLENQAAVLELDATLAELQQSLYTINQRIQELDDAVRGYQTLLAQGDRMQAERAVCRQRAAAVVQGYRTRDAAFRIFRNEKLERYKTLFDLAARYSFLAANAYDYETGLLNTDQGRSFINRIVSSRALGVVRNGEPQYAGSGTGDPGLSSALAEMKADWDVLRGRLGFNNPDGYGTTVSLRTELARILPGTEGDQNWQDLLQLSRMDNILDDSDVSRYCMQIDPGDGLPLPGFVISFGTTISPRLNLFGKPLAAGDHAFYRSSFATKIFAVGAAFEGYRGMADPTANAGAGGASPPDPDSWYLDPLALAATPYVYLIPVGVDSMRSPPLGDESVIRSWNVQDVTIPMPFNIGASDFSSLKLYQSADSLSEPLFGLRKHQAFRPVSTTAAFSPDIYGVGGSLQPSQFTNRRLIGRSVWNSQWKLVIPGDSLLNDPTEGLARFLQTVKDIKLYFITYSYAGN